MPLDHVSLTTTRSTHKRMCDFYSTILKPLGYSLFKEQDGLYLGLQSNMNPDFWLHCCPAGDMPLTDPSLTAGDNQKMLGSGRAHVAFAVGSRRGVDEWYRVAVKAGGIPNGEPGERPQYTKGYNAAFVLDPLGNNVEVVYYSPWWLKAMNAAPSVAIALFGAVAGHFAMGYARAAGWV